MRACFALLILLSFESNCQNLFTISLQKYKLHPPGVMVSEVVDARADQRVLGIIQRGLTDRKDLAVFAEPGLKELEGLIQRSDMLSSGDGIVVRMSKLAISEVTSIFRETAKAELSVDFFMKSNDRYFYMNSVYTSVEPKGRDVTHFHPSNIVSVFQKALAQFAACKNEILSAYAFTREDLQNPMVSFREISDMPIVKAAEYKDGYYASYEEFLNNEPSISLECMVKPGTNTLVTCGGEEQAINVYGYAKQNKLYVLFHHDFYHLRKDNNGFAFRGPKEISNKDVANYYKSMLAARQMREKRGHYSTYRIDLGTGAIHNTAGL